ncbi:MAG: DNA polymerase III subunit beta [Ruminococcus sp.]|jgi:DNA polymerase-3 subunit beta|nr:DNA polymerase III subunit beta [Ruminococcus sp.]
MKFTVDKAILFNALVNVSRAVADKSAILALEGIKFSVQRDTLKLTGYDLEIGITATVPVNADGEFEFVLSSKLVCQMVGKLPDGNIDFEYFKGDNAGVRITGKRIVTTLGSISADEYPNIPEYEKNEGFEIAGATLKNMVNMTRFAVAATDAKPILTGELFEIKDNVFNIVSLDGYRLAVRTERVNFDKNFNFVIKLKSLSDIVSLIREKKSDESDIIKVYVTKKSAAFEFDNFSIHTRLLEGEFHQYNRAIPAPERIKTTAAVNVPEFIRALERCQLLIDEKIKSPVRLTINNDEVALSCKSPRGELNDEIPCELTGQGIEIGFNAAYLISALKSSETDKVYLKLIDSVSPMIISPADGDAFLFLVLPIRLY